MNAPIPPHVAARCRNPECRLRFPVPVGDPRHGSCPACESPTDDVAEYPPPYPPPDDGRADHRELAGVLDNVRSALNVGTMLRAADGARLDHVHLCGLTPAGDHPKVAKTSLGAESSVGWSTHPDTVECVGQLRDAGWTVWAVESAPGAVALENIAVVPDRLAFVVGNERAGVDPDVLDAADAIVHLPMRGAKTTLNVGVAFGVVAYGIRRVRQASTG